MFMKQTSFCITLAMALLISAANAQQGTQKPPLGLSNDKGQILLNGKPYRGIGVNYFNVFARTLTNDSDQSFETGFKKLSEAGIPFARFMACGFWPSEWNLYLKDKEAYFKKMDRIIASAEKHQIGLIPSCFWKMACIPDIVGEPMDQLGNPNSKTIAFIEQYTEEIVQRYKHSPAIWAWEFGNEYNNHIDMPNAEGHRPPVITKLKTAEKRSDRDDLSSEMVETAYLHFAKTVRKFDPSRILSTGNTLPRDSAYHQAKELSWKKDTRAEFQEILLKQNPNPYVVSVHVYRNDGLGQTKSIAELMSLMKNTAAQSGKPLLVGEFGALKTLGSDKEKALFLEILSAIETSKVPLSALWVFDFSLQNKDWNVTFENERSYMLKHIAEAHQRIKIVPNTK
jgi:Cellulase (glycosyl hydrolase family 5)